MLSPAVGCEPDLNGTVVVDNQYPPSSTDPLVVYRAQFMTASFDAAIPPGASSRPLPTLQTSGDMAYVVLAPGWDPTNPGRPQSLVILESKDRFVANAGQLLRVPVSDFTFRGRCEAGSPLTQQEADTIASAFFEDIFIGLEYDAASCTTMLAPDAGQ